MSRLSPLWRGLPAAAAAAAAIAAVAFAGTVAGTAEAQQRGRFIVHQLTGLCLDVRGEPGATNGTPIQLAPCERNGRSPSGAATDQLWEITREGFIRSTVTGRCIDVSGAPGVNNRARIQLWECESDGRNRDNGTPTDQTWVLDPEGFIVNRLSNRCIDVPGAPGTQPSVQLMLFDCEFSGRNPNGSVTDQRWRLD